VKQATSTSLCHDISENNSSAVSDTTKLTRHRSENCHSVESTVIDSCKNKHVTGSSLTQRDASPSGQTRMTESDNNDVHTSLEKLDLPSGVENAGNFDVTITSSSANNCTDASMLCTSLSKQSSVFSSSSSQASDSPIGLTAVVECSGKETADGEQKSSLNSQEVNVTMTLPLSSTDEASEVRDMGTVRHRADGDEVIKDTVRHQVLSDLNSNNLLKSSQISVVTEKLCGDADVAPLMSVNADTSLPILSAVPDAEVVSDCCLLARVFDTNVPAPISLQPSVVLADVITQSPISLYRELEDIRSPSPALLGAEEDDRAKEIRSPSPCEPESRTSLFRVIETSWDVRLMSPCEIQSPDCSEDEADNSIEEFSRHCNVCFHQGPVTIPLTITEASKRMHNQQPDMA